MCLYLYRTTEFVNEPLTIRISSDYTIFKMLTGRLRNTNHIRNPLNIIKACPYKLKTIK